MEMEVYTNNAHHATYPINITFRNKSFRLFLSGDYELLCNYMAYQGLQVNLSNNIKWTKTHHNFTAGRHCCLWCHIRQQELKSAPNQRHILRSLATLAQAHFDFVTKAKSDHNVVKEYFNVLSPPFFMIPLEQVCTQSLLNLVCTSVYRLFCLLEEAVNKLDYKVAHESSPHAQTAHTSFSQYLNAIHQRNALREKKACIEEKAARMDQVVTLAAVNESTSLTINPSLVTAMLKEVAQLRKSAQDVVRFHTCITL